MQIAGYIASLLIGVSLGMIGGGGSILTVPVMVYLFGVQPLIATCYSLFVVGSTSLVGAFNNFRKGMVNIKAALLFGASSIITVFITRKFIVPAIPETLFAIRGIPVTKSLLIMVLFALLMLVTSISMIRQKRQENEDLQSVKQVSFLKLSGFGIGIGLLTGVLGAGGGFLLIPALVFLLGLPMKKAIGTSLMIIAMNSLIGFTGDLGHIDIDWTFLLTITAIAIAGIFLGGAIGKSLPGYKLKKTFGWFVLLMGMYILLKEIFLS
jgi:uncharacterized protein